MTKALAFLMSVSAEQEIETALRLHTEELGATYGAVINSTAREYDKLEKRVEQLTTERDFYKDQFEQATKWEPAGTH